MEDEVRLVKVRSGFVGYNKYRTKWEKLAQALN